MREAISERPDGHRDKASRYERAKTMTYSQTLALTLLKARMKKYKYRRPKAGGGYKYYYAEHHGGGISSAAFEAGSAFQLTFKGRRGHFHVKSVEGDMVTITHDARPGIDIPPIHKDELRELLKRQHGKAEEKSRERAQKKRKKKRSGAAKRRAKRTPDTPRKPSIKRMSASQRKALEEDLAKAIKDGDKERANDLIKADQADYAQSGDPTVDTLFKELINEGDADTFDDGSKQVVNVKTLSPDHLEALERAAQNGLIKVNHKEAESVYSLSSSTDKDRSLTLLVRGDRAKLTVDDFRPPTGS